MKGVRAILGLFCAAALLGLALPAIAGAETRTFLNTSNLFPSAGAGTEGRANVYPATIVVGGFSGTVSKATVTVFSYGSSRPNDTDMALRGPNGQTVMLLSDACGTGGMQNNNLTFDDAAATFVSSVACANYTEGSFKPSNYGDPANDSFPSGPTAPYLNTLATFNGAPANGDWSLFMFDDEAGFFGFEISGWALTLEVPSATGQRPAALKKCKKKKTAKARKKCRKKANKLPI